MIKPIIFSILLCSATAISAPRTATGTKISTIRVDSSGLAIVFVAATPSGTPSACVTSPQNTNGFAFNANTLVGRSILMVLQAAQLANKTIDISGTGSCLVYTANVEDLNLFMIRN